MTGFIPHSRASLMLDVVAIAMVAILPAVFFAVHLAKERQFLLHKNLMKTISVVLLVAVILFEIEIRMIGWQQLAAPSPYFDTWVMPTLIVHLCFAIAAATSLFATVILALTRFPSPPNPSLHSRLHKRLGKMSLLSLTGTSITGWAFYWIAFIAS